MDFVPTIEEEVLLTHTPREFRFFNGSVILVETQVDRAALVDLVPAALREGVTGALRFAFGRWDSNCAGSYSSASVTIPTHFEGVPGEYVVVMYVDSERAVQFGRDWFGEPKRHGTVSVEFEAPGATTELASAGEVLMRVGVSTQRDGFIGQTESRNFNMRARIDPNSEELVTDAQLNQLLFESEIMEHRVGTAWIEIPAVPSSPFLQLDIPSYGTGRLLKVDMRANYSELAVLEPREARRFFLGRMGHTFKALD